MHVLLARRRHLRRRATPAESLLWLHLRSRRFMAFKFRRQHPCGPFILDFYCAERALAIELDGGQHYAPEAQAYELRRTAYVQAQRITLLRFATDLVFRELEGVLLTIADALGATDPSSCPSPGRGRGEGT